MRNMNAPDSSLGKAVEQIVLRAQSLCVFFAVVLTVFYGFSSTANADTVLVVRPQSEHFKMIFQGLVETLEDEVVLVDQQITGASTADEVAKWLAHHNSSAIVLMDNAAVRSYARFQAKFPDRKFPPSIVVGTLFASMVIDNLKQSTGILYEIPAVTAIVDLRQLLKRPLKRVGVIYREAHKENFELQKRFCDRENIELYGYAVANDISTRGLNRRLKKLLKSDLDALWIMNDGDMLSKGLITGAWIPRLRKSKIPIVVGIKSLIKTRFKFGDYAIYPDHYELGVQAAGLVFDLMDNDWELLGSAAPQQPISIKKYMNVIRFDDKGIDYNADKLLEFDDLIQ